MKTMNECELTVRITVRKRTPLTAGELKTELDEALDNLVFDGVIDDYAFVGNVHSEPTEELVEEEEEVDLEDLDDLDLDEDFEEQEVNEDLPY
jgi:hypothetical protein